LDDTLREFRDPVKKSWPTSQPHDLPVLMLETKISPSLRLSIRVVFWVVGV
jgi:hypothetical protein